MIIDASHPKVKVYGTQVKGEGLRRIPAAVAEKVSESVATLSKQSSGIRLCFATDSRNLTIKAKYSAISNFYHMPLSGCAGFDLFEQFKVQDREVTEPWKVDYCSPQGVVSRWLHNYMIPTDTYERLEVESTWHQEEEGIHHYMLFLPLYAAVEQLEIELDDSANLSDHAYPYVNTKPYVFYGSSITHGGCANKPSNAYLAILSRKYHVDFLNLGFSGSAKGECEMADYIASLDMEAFVLDYDFNAPDVEWLQATHEPFFKRIRSAHPYLPIYILTACAHGRTHSHYQTLLERRKTIRRTYENAIAASDKNVFFLDMTECFYGDGCQSFCVDAVHPTDAGFMRMADWIGHFMFED